VKLLGALAFIVTILGLAGLGIGLIASLLTHHFRAAGRIGLLMLAWAGGYLVILLFASFTSRTILLDLGQEHCFDEMCYSVLGAYTSKTLGMRPNQMVAQGNFYILTVQLRNAARRQPQKPSQPELWVLDNQRRKYTQAVSAADGNGLAANQPVVFTELWNRQLQPGETQSFILAFDLPADISDPRLVITEGSGPGALIIGDENSFFHAKTEFRLGRRVTN
jgi:hypothetical protein